MSCLDDDLAEKDLFLEDLYGFDIIDDSFDDFPLEGHEGQFSCASADGDEAPVYDPSYDLEPHFTP